MILLILSLTLLCGSLSYLTSVKRIRRGLIFLYNFVSPWNIIKFSDEILPGVSHLKSSNIFGYKRYTQPLSILVNEKARKSRHGLCTFWIGPIPFIYIGDNRSRLAILQESRVGVTDELSSTLHEFMFNNNRVSETFPAFRNINSEAYKIQRRHLMKLYHGQADSWLSQLQTLTTKYLVLKRKEIGKGEKASLREFITSMVLHSSSHLLGLTRFTLDVLYETDERFRHAIAGAANYVISLDKNVKLEKNLFEIFLIVVKNNYEVIIDDGKPNIIENIMSSLDPNGNYVFPDTFEAYLNNTPIDLLEEAAMNFAAVGMGAMAHSTSNAFDWALARLLESPDKLLELSELMSKHKNVDLTDTNVYDKNGILFPLTEWILYNVFLYPTFGHENFLNLADYDVILEDEKVLTIPGKSVILINYLECNRSNNIKSLTEFSKVILKDTCTIGRFINDKRVASFGGSVVNKENKQTRICPGAKISLYEQIIMLALLLKEYKMVGEGICCDIDPDQHPLISRVNQGYIGFT